MSTAEANNVSGAQTESHARRSASSAGYLSAVEAHDRPSQHDASWSGGILNVAEGVTLFLGDWRDALPFVADALITDQPYGTGWIRGGGKKAGEFKRRKETAEWDVFDLAWMEHAPETVASFCPDFGIWEMCLRLKTPCVLKYRKTNPAPHGYASEAIVCSRPLAGPWEKEAYNGDNELHPCQKPVPLIGWLVRELTSEGQTVIDPFMGSASTAIACIRLGRNFIGCERDPVHFKTAEQRIRRELEECVFKFPKGAASCTEGRKDNSDSTTTRSITNRETTP